MSDESAPGDYRDAIGTVVALTRRLGVAERTVADLRARIAAASTALVDERITDPQIIRALLEADAEATNERNQR